MFLMCENANTDKYWHDEGTETYEEKSFAITVITKHLTLLLPSLYTLFRQGFSFLENNWKQWVNGQ